MTVEEVHAEPEKPGYSSAGTPLEDKSEKLTGWKKEKCGVDQKERKRHRETERERETHRQTDRDRQTDRQTDRKTEREGGRQSER